MTIRSNFTLDCGHSVSALYNNGLGTPDRCALCELGILADARGKLADEVADQRGKLVELRSELSSYKKVVGLLKMSELIALAEKAGMTVQVSIVKNGNPE